MTKYIIEFETSVVINGHVVDYAGPFNTIDESEEWFKKFAAERSDCPNGACGTMFFVEG